MPFTPDDLFALRIRTPRVELRIPTDADIDELVAVAHGGVHDPAEMPFRVAWTDVTPEELAVNLPAYQRERRGQFGTDDWTANFVVVARDRDGAVIGSQGVSPTKSGNHGASVGTGSWIGRRFQGCGYGTEMRAAVLAFAFDALSVPAVGSGAYLFNQASLGVSRKLGYVEVGRRFDAPRGEPQELIELRLDRDRYFALRPDIPVEIIGFDAVRDAFPLPRVLDR